MFLLSNLMRLYLNAHKYNHTPSGYNKDIRHIKSERGDCHNIYYPLMHPLVQQIAYAPCPHRR